LAIILFFASFLFIFFGFIAKGKNNVLIGFYTNVRLAFVKSCLLVSLISYLLAEILSIQNRLNYSNTCFAWFIVALVTGYFFLKQKSAVNFSAFKLGSFNLSSFSLKGIEKKYSNLFLFSVVFILFPLLLLSIFIPPNNWDSLAYHLPRIEHWIQDKNIYPYPTNLIRQIITPPMSEYILLQLRMLSGNDWYLNLVQYFSLLGVLLMATQILSFVKINYKGQLLVYFMLLSLPLLVFQSTTTQTDLLATFYLLSFLLFSWQYVNEEGLNKWTTFYLVLSLCLGVLTKYTVAIFALPFIAYLVYFVLMNVFINGKAKIQLIVTPLIMAIGLSAITIAPYLIRNQQAFGSLTGNEYFSASMSNSKLSLQYTISNCFKNVADFISVPMNTFNNILFTILNKAHSIIGISINDKGANWNNMDFVINNHINEDSAGSLLHFLIVCVSIAFSFTLKNKKSILIYLSGLFLTLIIYSAIIRYSPWNNRLFLPLTILFLLSAAYILHLSIINPKVQYGFKVLLFIIATLPVYFNRAKPIIADPFYLKRVLSHSPKAALGSKTVFEKSRMENYFVWTPFLQRQLDTVFNQIPTDKNRIDLSTEFDSHEYMIWLYAQKHFMGDFYIGTSQKIHYKPFPQNFPKADRYTIALKDSVMHWKSVILSK
jgi:hypothetical protein